MFLGWKEIKHAKLRYGLIIGVLVLVSYLVFVLSGLANGLKDLNRQAVDSWDASAIILTADSDISLPSSSFTLADGKKIDVPEKNKAYLGNLSTVIQKVKTDDKEKVSIFGIDKTSFVMPELSSGKAFSKIGEVVAADVLKEEGYKVGDTFKVASSDKKVTIVGFTPKAKFNAAPVLYTSMATYQDIKFDRIAEDDNFAINAIALKGDKASKVDVNSDFEVTKTESFIEKLPGYSAQSLTLNFMIIFLFVIVSIIIAIFLYVLTIQKVSMFGVMKAQGISSGFLARSVVAQTFILAFIGVVIGFGLTAITGAALPAAVPISIDYITLVFYAILFIIVAIIGAFVSVRTIVKIDPLKAIGG